MTLHLGDDLLASTHLRDGSIRADDSRVGGGALDLRIGVHATLAEHVHAGFGGTDR